MPSHSKSISRRQLIKFPCAMVMIASAGCMAPWMRKPDPDSPEARKSKRDAIKEILQSEDRPRLIRDIANPRLLTLSRMENLGLVTQLQGTGGTVSASSQREKILDVMRRREADQPNQLLDDMNTAMVVSYVNVPPAARKGTFMTVGVKLSAHATGTSLRNGWLMPTELSESQVLGGAVREGFDIVNAEGPIITEAQVTGSDAPEAQLSGFIIGGAKLLKDRPLGVGIIPEFADAYTQAALLPAINERFTHFDGQKKGGIATPKMDSYIELAIPQRYLHDPYHFINVVLSLGFAESPEKRAERLEVCRKELMQPTSARDAAWQLEGIGDAAKPILAEALSHPHPEVRFYAAHSLAYLNDVRAVNVLAQLAQQQAAFRAMCLNGLVIINHFEAEDMLQSLLHCADSETRFGAISAIRLRDPNNPQVTGLPIGKVGSILEIPTNSPPLVAVSLDRKPEIVIFGDNPVLALPPFMYVNSRIVLKTLDRKNVTVNHFAPNQEDRVVKCSTDLRSVLSAIAEVGGTYGDWITFLRECSTQGYLAEPLAINPAPKSGRTFDREKMTSVELAADAVDSEGTAAKDVSPADETPKTAYAWYNPFTWWN
jgi:hypothetical protein